MAVVSARRPSKRPETLPNKQNVMRLLEAEQKAARDARYAAQKAAKKRRRGGY